MVFSSYKLPAYIYGAGIVTLNSQLRAH